MEDPYDFITKDAIIPEAQQKILETCPFINESVFSNKNSPFADNFRAGISSTSQSKNKEKQTVVHDKEKQKQSQTSSLILGSKKKSTDISGNPSASIVDLTKDSDDSTDDMDADQHRPKEVDEEICLRWYEKFN